MRFIIFLLFVTTFSFSNDELININFKNLSIKELIKITSQQINKNILITKDIKGKVNFISNEPMKKTNLLKILKFSLEDNGYKLINSGDILRVVKIAELEDIKKEKVVKEKTNKEIPIETKKNNTFIHGDNKSIYNFTEVISLMNIDAVSVSKILKTIISQRKYSNNIKPSISLDEGSNSIILDGKELDVLSLKNVISKLDIQKSQVYVKAKIIEIDDNLLEDIGIKFGILGGKVHSGGLYTFSSSLNGADAVSVDIGSIGLKIPNLTSSLALGASLSLLNKTYALDIISEPSILCLNNKESSIYVGETVSIQTGSITTDGGTTKNSFNREDIGLTLKVKPRITSDNKVTLDINTILEGIKNSNNLNFTPDTSKKEIKTTAIVNNGESVIIGGLIESKNENSIQKVPYASDVPLIGELFKNRTNTSNNKNLVVIITPYIIPKDKDLTFVRNELSKLKSLEDSFLEDVLVSLKEKQKSGMTNKKINTNFNNIQKHNQRLKKYFGI